MAELTDPQKQEIVELLACFSDLASISERFRLEYGLEVSARQVGSYDPSRSYYEGGDKWRVIFDARRKRYIEEVTSIPIANQGYRLNLLHELAEKARLEKKPGLLMQVLEQAAKEVGGILTNQRELRVDDNRRQKAADMTPEDRRAAMAEIIRQAMENRDPPGTAPAPVAIQ